MGSTYNQFFKGGYNTMGFYDNNRHTALGSNIEFDLLEGYCGAAGAAMAALEGQYNNMAIFESAIASDFQEAIALKEGQDIEALQEAGIKGMFEAIINFLKKLGDKIKSLFTKFIAKMESYMKKDTKAFVEKYRTQVNKKANFKDMKAKFSKPLNTGSGHAYVWGKDYELDLKIKDLFVNDSVYNGARDDDNFDMSDEIDRCLSTALGNSTTKKEFQNDLHDLMYDTEEIKDDWNLNDINNVMSRLVDADKAISNLKSKNDSLQNQIKKIIANISKQQTSIATAKYDSKNDSLDIDARSYTLKTKGNKKYEIEKGGQYSTSVTKDTFDKHRGTLQIALANMQKRANAHQTAILTYCSGVMAEAKWGLAQDRRIFAQAVGYSPKNESALLAEAMGDVAQWECESYFEEAEVLGE